MSAPQVLRDMLARVHQEAERPAGPQNDNTVPADFSLGRPWALDVYDWGMRLAKKVARLRMLQRRWAAGERGEDMRRELQAATADVDFEIEGMEEGA